MFWGREREKKGFAVVVSDGEDGDTGGCCGALTARKSLMEDLTSSICLWSASLALNARAISA